MQNRSEELKIAVLLVTIIILLFSITIIFLIFIFNKKKQLSIKEQEIRESNLNQTILRSQIEIQEQTFNNISQEIHDNVGQILSLAKVQLNIISESENQKNDLIQDASENISKALADLRDIAKGLNGERVLNLGLIQSLEQETQRINRIGFLNIQLSIKGVEYGIDQQKQLIIFRTIQECIQNIIKHAMASLVQISFNFSDKELLIIIIDNGKGFNLKDTRLSNHGLGISNIFKRIELIGGHVDIQSIIQEGTTIKLSIPYA